jgi:hypothetical protein
LKSKKIYNTLLTKEDKDKYLWLLQSALIQFT